MDKQIHIESFIYQNHIKCDFPNSDKETQVKLRLLYFVRKVDSFTNTKHQNTPSTSGSAWVGTRFRTRAALPRMRRIPSLPQRCEVTSPCSWPEDLARQWERRVTCRAADSSQLPKVDTARGWNEISSALHASPCFCHFLLKATVRAYYIFKI
jgi:hypothetical protein